ncbi:hypothetical protein LCGC14_2563750 [marine sediment metagenome]|uniref:Uncharacterized protein n=1 Tax=marine sediment metagenome TaxID=412755 RepID=A0A0F9CVG5_9ZZZZ
MESWVIKAVEDIVVDLSDRQGMSWDMIDPDIQKRIRRSWCLIIESAFNSSKVSP